MEVVDHALFRVTRDTDYDVSDEADDLRQAVEEEIRRRRFGEVVRLEVEASSSERLRERLVAVLGIEADQVYEIDGLIGMDDLFDIAGVSGHDELRYPPFSPVTQPRLQVAEGEQGRRVRRDPRGRHPRPPPLRLVHDLGRAFVKQAVDDPDVLAIKQTVYRTSADSPLVPALIEASERGKQAVCMVELKARFDEQANITLGEEARAGRRPRRLRDPGAEDARQVRAGRPPRGRRRPPLRPRRDRQLQPEDGAAVHRPRPVHRRSGASAPTSPRCSTT